MRPELSSDPGTVSVALVGLRRRRDGFGLAKAVERACDGWVGRYVVEDASLETLNLAFA